MGTLTRIVSLAAIIVLLILLGGCKDNTTSPDRQTDPSPIHDWANVTNGLPTTTAFTLVAIDSTIYVYAAHSIHYSTDLGATWLTPASDGLPSAWINDMAGHNGSLFLATDSMGVYASDNSGASWYAPANVGLSGLSKYVHSIAMSDQYLFVGAGNDAVVYRSSDLGDHWTACANGFPATTSQYYPRIHSLLYTQGRLYACPTFSGLYYSDDNGDTWNPMNQGLPFDANINQLSVLDTVMYATVGSGFTPGLYKRSISNPIWVKFPINVGTDWSPHFVVADSSTVLVSSDGGVLISFDAGANWQQCHNGLPEPAKVFMYHAVLLGGNVFVGDNYHAVWRYTF